MGKLTFRGGVHPYDGKDLSKDKPIKPYSPVEALVYPLSQHIGAPAVPVVKVGDHVLAGQKIAEAAGFMSAPIYSAVSGTVKAVEPRLTAAGRLMDSIVIESDGKFDEVSYPSVKPVSELSKEEIRNMIREAGIVGMGGAGFPTHVKLTPKDDSKIDYVIANCAECEPYITCDYRRMIENPDMLIGGMKIILKLFENAKGILAVEDNKPEAIEILSRLVKNEPNIEVKILKTKYPQGAERQIIYATTGRAINSSMLPADVGCIVDNVETIINIYRSVVEGKPVMHRVVTVTGSAVKEPGNFYVPIGTNVNELIKQAGGFKTEPARIISGGPMMGIALSSLDVPVTKTTSALVCLTEDEASTYEPSDCINCGRCANVCPSRLVPARLADFAECNDEESFIKWNGLECYNCGSCSYECPAKRHLAQTIYSMRGTILANRKQKK